MRDEGQATMKNRYHLSTDALSFYKSLAVKPVVLA